MHYYAGVNRVLSCTTIILRAVRVCQLLVTALQCASLCGPRWRSNLNGRRAEMEGRQCPWHYTPSRKATAKRGSASFRVPARAVSRPGGTPSVGEGSLRFLDPALDIHISRPWGSRGLDASLGRPRNQAPVRRRERRRGPHDSAIVFSRFA
jgi:hypothetical protein